MKAVALILYYPWEAVTIDHVEEGHHPQTTTFQVFQVVKLQAGGGLLQIWCCIFFSDCTSFPHFSINPHDFLWYWHSEFLTRLSEIRQSWWWNMVRFFAIEPTMTFRRSPGWVFFSRRKFTEASEGGSTAALRSLGPHWDAGCETGVVSDPWGTGCS